jgi:tRNA U34 5-carboxymethylaminomethyl modifying enzyme MnmG/GidA
MQTEIIEFVKEKRNGKRQRVGCFVGKLAMDKNNTVLIGWSRANVKIDKFDEGKAFQIADGRANSTTPIFCPSSLEKKAIKFRDRCRRFFKGASVRGVVKGC